MSPRSPRSPRRPGIDLPGFQELNSGSFLFLYFFFLIFFLDLFISPRSSKPHVMDQPLPQIHEISSNASIDSIFQGKNGKKQNYQNDPRQHSDFGTTPPPMYGFDSPFPSSYTLKSPRQPQQSNPQQQQSQSHSQQQQQQPFQIGKMVGGNQPTYNNNYQNPVRKQIFFFF